MNAIKLLREIQTARTCGIAFLTIYEKPASVEWKQSVFEYFSITRISAEAFEESLVEINSNKLARAILSKILYQDLAYNSEIISLAEAKILANKFFFII